MKKSIFKSFLATVVLMSLLLISTLPVSAQQSEDQQNKSVETNTSIDKTLPESNNKNTDLVSDIDNEGQDKRVIINSEIQIVEDDACECIIIRQPGGFRLIYLLGLIPVSFVIAMFIRSDDENLPIPQTPPSVSPMRIGGG
jgi:hypothetical protein